MKKVFSIFSLCLMFMMMTIPSSGHSFAEDSNIQNGIPISAQITEGEKNIYTFTTTDDGEVYVTLDNAIGNYKITLFDANGKEITTGYRPSTNSIGSLYGKIQKGSYSIQVELMDSGDHIQTGSYRLKATYASSFTRNLTTYEPNDTMQTSMPLKNGEFITSTADHYQDRDVYQFTTDKVGDSYIVIDKIVGNFNFYLYDSSGNYVDHPHRAAPEGLAFIETEKLPKGTYYLIVQPYYSPEVKTASYRIKATFSSAFTRDKTTLEPNDTDDTSVPMISNQYYSSDCYTLIDRDFYQLTTSKDGNVNVVLDNTVGQFAMWLYDSRGFPFSSAHGYTEKSGDKIILNINLPKGIYYLHIVTGKYEGLTNSSYRVKATFSDFTPSVESVLDIDTVVKGEAPSDTKVFAWVGTKKIGETVAKNGKYNITIPPQKVGTVINVYTVNSTGNTSATKSTKVIDSTINAVSSSYNKIKVSWNNVPGASGYEIFQSTSSTGIYSWVGNIQNGNILNFTNSGLTTGKMYYYKVKAYRIVNGTYIYTSFTKNTSAKPIPATPTGLVTKKINSSSMTLSWVKVEGGTGYQVYRSTSKTGTYSLTGTVTNGNSSSITNKSLLKGKTYY
ncbi:Ig-like domain-containing protein [Gottfriedia sp. NPDC058432]|uniref:Ig-like domain-containing protein n=1 Tax=Gottfriedia sp. NPDC058432 TaxID=3346497 RepID=UPI00366340FB